MCRFRERKKQRGKKKKTSRLFPEKSSEVIAAVFTRLCVCARGYVTWAGIHCCSWWSLQRSAPLASACTSWTDRGNRRSGPGPRQRADEGQEQSSAAIIKHDVGPQNQNQPQDLSGVLVGRSEGAVGVGGVQAGPVHVAVPDACLFQHFLKTVHADVWPFHVLQELLGVKAGPLESGFTSEKCERMRLGLATAFSDGVLNSSVIWF